MNLPAPYLAFLREGTTVPFTDFKRNPSQLVPIAETDLKVELAWVGSWEPVGDQPEPEEDPHEHEGYYQVPFISLMRCADLYDDGYGTLCWLPEESLFASYDIEHLCFYVFTDTSWDEIRANADAFVSILAGEENPKTVTLIPWPKYAWFPSEEAEAMREAK